MERKTLVVLAAGIGSRFGGGIKRLEPIDDYGQHKPHYRWSKGSSEGTSRGLCKPARKGRHQGKCSDPDHESYRGRNGKAVCKC